MKDNTRIQWSPLHSLSSTDLLKKFLTGISSTFWVTLFLSIISLPMDGHWQKIIVNSVQSLISMPIAKLMFYMAMLTLGAAAMIRGLPKIASLVQFAGDKIASLAFDFFSTIIGILMGAFFVAWIQSGTKIITPYFHAISLMVCCQIVLLLSSMAASGIAFKEQIKLNKEVEKTISTDHALRIVGGIIFVVFLYTINAERWPEFEHNDCLNTDQITQDKTKSEQAGLSPVKANRNIHE